MEFSLSLILFSSSDAENEIPPVNALTEKDGTNIQLGEKCFEKHALNAFDNEFIKMTHHISCDTFLLYNALMNSAF